MSTPGKGKSEIVGFLWMTKSLRAIAEGENPDWRDFVVAHATGGGKMLRTDTHKLITYEDDPVIQLFDMDADPWETRNLAEAPESRARASEMQEYLTAFESEFELAET